MVQVKYFKQLLLYCVAGLDRGFAANDTANEEVERAVSSLQGATSPVVLSWTSGALLPAPALHSCSCADRLCAPCSEGCTQTPWTASRSPAWLQCALGTRPLASGALACSASA